MYLTVLAPTPMGCKNELGMGVGGTTAYFASLCDNEFFTFVCKVLSFKL